MDVEYALRWSFIHDFRGSCCCRCHRKSYGTQMVVVYARFTVYRIVLCHIHINFAVTKTIRDIFTIHNGHRTPTTTSPTTTRDSFSSTQKPYATSNESSIRSRTPHTPAHIQTTMKKENSWENRTLNTVAAYSNKRFGIVCTDTPCPVCGWETTEAGGGECNGHKCTQIFIIGKYLVHITRRVQKYKCVYPKSCRKRNTKNYDRKLCVCVCESARVVFWYDNCEWKDFCSRNPIKFKWSFRNAKNLQIISFLYDIKVSNYSYCIAVIQLHVGIPKKDGEKEIGIRRVQEADST